MTKLIITRGYPGAGKSTKAREWVAENSDERARVNRDDLRWNLYGARWGLTWDQEKSITEAQRSAVTALIKAGKSVIVDDTNLRLRFARQWADLAVSLGADFEVWDIVTDPTECKSRDDHRDRHVGPEVIDTLAQKFPRPWPEVKPSERKPSTTPAFYEPKPDAPTCYLVDIDGTVALMDGRSPYDMSAVSTDRPNRAVIDVIRHLSQHHEVVFLSGRTSDAREATEEWLAEHVPPYAGLYMRASGDNRKDFIVKAELFDQHVRDQWNVLAVFDDRKQVVDMWRSIGLPVFQVADGDF